MSALEQAHDALVALAAEARLLRDRSDMEHSPRAASLEQALTEAVYGYVRYASAVAGQRPSADREAANNAIALGELLAKAGRFTVRYLDAMEAGQ